MPTLQPSSEAPKVPDTATTAAEFRADLRRGLAATPKSIPPKYFYDKRGSELFERICRLEEYYPTRTEEAILADHGREIASLVGPRAWLIEPGAGDCTKSIALLNRLDRPAAFTPIEISGRYLRGIVTDLEARLPAIEIVPVCADFTKPLRLPEPAAAYHARVLFFPGSTIGNLGAPQRAAALERFADLVGPRGWLLIGIDLRKDRATLERAYNDAQGVTAAFNLNVLRRARDEFGVGVDPAGYAHFAAYNEPQGRIEMHLVSLRRQSITIGDDVFPIAEGEHIVTEHSNKFTVDGFVAEATPHGWGLRHSWTDPQRRFAVLLLRRGS